MADFDLCEALAPLTGLMGSNLRLVARPGWVMLDRPEGSSRLEVSWTAEQHAAVAEALGSPVDLDPQTTVAVVAGTLILRRGPDPLRRTEDLIRDGWVSPLAGRMLTQAVGLGRNVLVVGPWTVSAEVIGGVLADGQRPAMVARTGDASPASWPRLSSAEEAIAYGADRIGAWSLPADELVELMGQCSGVIAWTDARRLDRALVRFEVGVEAFTGRSTSPLHVLAGLDLVVVTTDQGGPRVRELAEVTLVEDGYRPRFLFAAGMPPVPTALLPLGAPSFLAELVQAGQTVLADELRHATAGSMVAPAAEEPASTAGMGDVVEPASAPVVESPGAVPGSQPMSSRAAPAPPAPDPRLSDAAPPGWELDQLGDDEGLDASERMSSADEAVMAATYGLAPPPRPVGVSASDANTFEDALSRARERQEELDQEMAADAEPADG